MTGPPGLKLQLPAGLDLVDLSAVWSPQFPSAELVEAAAALLPEPSAELRATVAPELLEGPRSEIVITPGTVQVRTRDWSKAERSAEREIDRRRTDVDIMAAWLAEDGELPSKPESSREITGWSRKSRARMVKTLCELDYAPLFADPSRLPAMTTLTYPGDWRTVAPTGREPKAHLKMLCKRYQRAWGEPWIGPWKLEFQHRGAPHYHLLMTPPHGEAKTTGQPFRQWLSTAWADIVNHPDPEERAKHERAGTGVDYAEGLRAKDPRRVSVYFLKHGMFSAKDYQNEVPEAWQQPGCGPGRFWGVWGLKPVRSVRLVDVDVGIAAGRVIRRWARAQRVYQRRQVVRVEQSTGRVRYRTSNFRVVRLADGRGWVSVNDGPGFASQLSRYLATIGGEGA